MHSSQHEELSGHRKSFACDTIMRLECRCPEKDEMPKQNNGCDCGVFALLFAEYASRNAQFNFSQRHINAYRTKIVSDVATMKIGIPPQN